MIKPQNSCASSVQGRYLPKNKETHNTFAKIHDKINLVVTGETAKDIRNRVGIKKSELLRDYFPLNTLVYYSAMSICAANAIKDGNDPIQAINKAASNVLPRHYRPQPLSPGKSVRKLEKELKDMLNNNCSN